MVLPPWLERLAPRLARPLWISYLASAAFYLYRIIEALRAPERADYTFPFSGGGWGPDLFYLAGTMHWLTVGVNRRGDPVRSAASMALAGMHVLLFAIRAYLGPLLWAVRNI